MELEQLKNKSLLEAKKLSIRIAERLSSQLELTRQSRIWPTAKALALIVENAYWAVRLSVGKVENRGLPTGEELTLEEEVEYAERTFREYKVYGAISRWGRVAEVGPGSTAAVALLMRVDGATSVDLIDRYYRPSDPQAEALLYDRLAEGRELISFRDQGQWNGGQLSGITWFTGQPAEDYFARVPAKSYDAVVSRATLEHLTDPLGALQSMIGATRPGGRLVHKIDLRDHNHFSKSGNHPLTWLTIPDSLWQLTTGYSGRPNRILAHRYRGLLDNLAAQGVVDYDLLVMRLIGGDRVDPHKHMQDIDEAERERALALLESIRPRLAPEFVSVSPEDLITAGVCVIIRKR